MDRELKNVSADIDDKIEELADFMSQTKCLIRSLEKTSKEVTRAKTFKLSLAKPKVISTPPSEAAAKEEVEDYYESPYREREREMIF